MTQTELSHEYMPLITVTVYSQKDGKVRCWYSITQKGNYYILNFTYPSTLSPICYVKNQITEPTTIDTVLKKLGNCLYHHIVEQKKGK